MRPAQIDAVRAAARAAFVRRLHAHLRERAPDYLSGLEPAAAEAEVDALTARAQAMGLLSRDQIRRYALVAAFATGRAGNAPPAWFEAIATRERPSAPLRLLELEDALIHRGRTRRSSP